MPTGTLPPSQRPAVESAARRRSPRSSASSKNTAHSAPQLQTNDPIPAIDWNRLSQHLSEAVAQQADQDVLVYSMPWVRRVAGLAIAASLAIVIGVGLGKRKQSPGQSPGPIADRHMMWLRVSSPSSVPPSKHPPVQSFRKSLSAPALPLRWMMPPGDTATPVLSHNRHTS